MSHFFLHNSPQGYPQNSVDNYVDKIQPPSESRALFFKGVSLIRGARGEKWKGMSTIRPYKFLPRGWGKVARFGITPDAFGGCFFRGCGFAFFYERAIIFC